MKFIFHGLVIFSFFISSCGKNEKQNDLFNSLTLQTVDHQNFSFAQLGKNKASIILFLQPECPFCNSYGKTLKHLDSAFTSKEVKMYAVVAGKYYPDSEIIAYRNKFALQFPFLLDPDFALAKNLKATMTPQAFLIDSHGNVVYHGMIDNWGYEIGKTRAHATEFYLTDAVNLHLAGKPVVPDSTKAVGCYIQ
jgi:thioredoxin-related protein